MSTLTNLPERALELAASVGENLRNAAPSAGKWLETGAKLGALRGGVRIAGQFARRNPVLLAAAAAGAGLLWYAAHRRAQRVANGHDSIEGSARRVEAKAGNGRRATKPRPAARRARDHDGDAAPAE